MKAKATGPPLLKRSARKVPLPTAHGQEIPHDVIQPKEHYQEPSVVRRQKEDSFFSAVESSSFSAAESSPRFGISPRFGAASDQELETQHRTLSPTHAAKTEGFVEDLMCGLETSFQNLRLSDSLGIKLPPSLPLTPMPKLKTYVISSDEEEDHVATKRNEEGAENVHEQGERADDRQPTVMAVSSDSSCGPISTIRRRDHANVSHVESTSSAALLEETGSLNPESAYADNSVPASPSLLPAPKSKRPAAAQTGAKRLKPAERQKVAQSWYSIYNEIVFENLLPKEPLIVWNPRLRKTAGQAVFVRFNKECSYHDTEEEQLESMMQGLSLTPRSSARGARYEFKRIDLSPKILTTEDKLATTLLHECCHVAQRLLDSQNDPPHGPVFKQWATKASKHFPQYKVTTRHDFALDQPHRWLCDSCSMVYKRYSKSIDPSRHRCGIKGCHGHLTYLGAFNPDGSAKNRGGGRGKPLSRYQLFVKDNYPIAYTQEGSHTAAMAWLSRKWKESKETDQLGGAHR